MLQDTKKIKNLRWWVVGLIAAATAINYLDRQNLPVALSEIRKTFSISDMQYGMINSIFLFAYGTMYAVGGRLLDITGTRIGYSILIIWWSLANIVHGFVSSVLGLGAARFLLGMGEGGAFPGSAKVVAEWFPAKERAFAFGLFNTGSSVGATIAPPLIALIVYLFNWRWAFIISGLLGLIWVLCWLRLYSKPSESSRITEEEKNYLAVSFEREGDPGAGSRSVPWMSLFRYRKVWGLIIIKFLTDAGWYFFIFWLPKYLNDVRGLNIREIGAYAWIPYAFAGAGSFIGGWLSSWLIKRKLPLDLARKIPLGIAAAMLPASLLITGASLNMAILFFSMAMFGHQSWSTLVQTLAADMFPSRVVGSVAGLAGCVGTYGAMLFSLLVSYLIGHFGYTPAFVLAGLLHPISFLLVLAIIKKVELVNITGPAAKPLTVI
jgi:ACS family hexuronate transporter-like MFS transporter